MRGGAARGAFAGLLLSVVALASPAPPEPAGDGAEAVGRAIYERGVGGGGREIAAAIGDGAAEIPASVLPCVGCHGADGRGRPEGGVSPSDVTWEALTKPYGKRSADGREHPPYDERSLIRAVTMGVDPAGNRLNTAMPRYRLTPDEAAALVDYLERLGKVADPGVGDEAVRLGAILPPAGRFPGLGPSLRAVLEAFAAETNEAGGIYGRRLELVFLEPPADPAARLEAVSGLLEQPVFALVAGFIAGADEELATLAGERRVPLIGPLTFAPQVGQPLNRYVFYLISGPAQQGRALVDFAASRLGEPAGRIAVAHPREDAMSALAEAIRNQGRRHGGDSVWSAIAGLDYAPGTLDPVELARRELEAGTEVLFLAAPEADAVALLRAAEAAGWRPHVFLPASGSEGVPAALGPESAARLHLAFPTLATDFSPQGLRSYSSLADSHDLPREYRSLQLAALAAAGVLAEALQRCGRELRRERLVEVLEGFYDYDTGLTPPLTFGPDRRIGALGAYVLPVDPGSRMPRPPGEWVTPR